MSYIVWGGVAANLVLQTQGLCQTHHSVHDVEMMLVGGDGRILFSNGLVLHLNSFLANDVGLPLVVGGVPTWQKYSGKPATSFSLTRAQLRDGDLDINRLALIVEGDGRIVMVEDPSGFLRTLVRGDKTVSMMDASDLRSVEQLARRVYRTISKVIRLEIAAGLALSDSSRNLLSQLVRRFRAMVEANVGEAGWPAGRRSLLSRHAT